MGMHAAHCMAGDVATGEQLFNLDLFTHVTRFLGHRIVLLGQYNGQRLQAEPDSDIVTYSRSTEVILLMCTTLGSSAYLQHCLPAHRG